MLAAGADFRLLGPKATHAQVHEARRLGLRRAHRLRQEPDDPARDPGRCSDRADGSSAIRHPMPYGDLVQAEGAALRDAWRTWTAPTAPSRSARSTSRTSTRAASSTPASTTGRSCAEAEKEADVIVWDGGNNDLPFYEADLEIVVADPHRPGHELQLLPRRGQPAPARRRGHQQDRHRRRRKASRPCARSIREVNPGAMVVDAASPIFVDDARGDPRQARARHRGRPDADARRDEVRRRRRRRQKFGAAEIVDPRPYAVGSIAETFEKLPGDRHAAAGDGLRRGADAGPEAHDRADAVRPGADRHADRPAPHREDHEARAARAATSCRRSAGPTSRTP